MIDPTAVFRPTPVAAYGVVPDTSANAVPRDGFDRFPYRYTPELDVPRFQRFRAEGKSFWASLPHAIDYMRKYLSKNGLKRTAPPEEVRHFDGQRELWQALKSVPPTTAAHAVRLGLVGDIMWIRDSWSTFLSPEARDRINSCQAVVGNLETAVSKSFRVPHLFPDTMRYNSDPALVTSFSRADGTSSFNALSIANNHLMDKGVQGVQDTLEFLKSHSIPASGARFDPADKRYTTFTVNGIRFGFYAATWGLNDPKLETTTPVKINLLKGLEGDHPDAHKVNLDEMRSVLQEMKDDGVDFRIVSLHWGHEFESYPIPEQMQVARDVVALGADVIMGTHPHVAQPPEVLFVNGYEKQLPPAVAGLRGCQSDSGNLITVDGDRPRKALVLYSLGNFVSTCYTDPCNIGVLSHLTVSKDDQKQTDWSLPGFEYFFMAHTDASGERKFHPLDRWLAQPQATEGTRNEAAWVKRHLEGDR